MNPIFQDFRGAAIRLEPQDIDLAAQEARIEPAALRAVLKIEAAGSGFDKTGRPKMLFEPHIFYRQLKDGLREKAVAKGLAYPKWGEKPYPKGPEAQFVRLQEALTIDQSAALKSASWGLGQIMGSNHKLAGYGDVETMVLAAMDSELAQLRMVIAFIENTGLLDELRERDWAAFARGYNGPGYAKHQYDAKLAAAYKSYVG